MLFFASSRIPHTSLRLTGPLSAEKAAQLLKHLVLARFFQPLSAKYLAGDSWQNGATGMGHGGLQCVVCQSTRRAILAPLCRGLSLYEDCRKSLMINNFRTRIRRQQDVVGFSRLHVPWPWCSFWSMGKALCCIAWQGSADCIFDDSDDRRSSFAYVDMWRFRKLRLQRVKDGTYVFDL